MQKNFAELTDKEIVHLLDRIFKNLADSFPNKMSDIPVWGVNKEAGFSWVRTDPPSEYPNLIFDVRLSQENVDEKLRRIKSRMKSGELPPVFTVGPCSRPPDLREHLLKNGFESLIVFPGMAFDLEKIDEAEIDRAPLRLPRAGSKLGIREITTDADFQDWVRVNNSGFQEHFRSSGCELSVYSKLRNRQSAPFVKFYGAYLDGRMIGAAQANFYPEEFECKLVELHQCSVLPEYRKMGIARRLVTRPLIEAKQDGYVISTIFAAPKAADPFWISVGFQHYCDLEWFVPD